MACTGGSFPIRTSDDLVTWKDTGAAILPTGTAPWAGDGFRNWAPEMHKAATQYVAYYTASDKTGRLCIGAAHATSPVGPWTDRGTAIVRDANLGAIDAHFFADDDGKQYLYWKLDGNAVGQPTPILVQELAADGMSFAAGSAPREVLRNDPSTWEGGVVEAPWVIRRGATYFLFYSANVYDERYATGVARASSPFGPFAKKGAPILQNDAAWVGPGHGSVVVAHGNDFFFHHAWPTNGAGVRNAGAGRWDLVEPIVYAGGWPSFAGNASASGPLAWP
jgi:beta-xylosidase